MILLYDLAISVALVLISGFVSGMTVGMLSIDPIQLRVLQDQGTTWQKKRARKLEEMLGQHHLVLVTLLLANSIALEALPIFLNKCLPGVMAVALSVTLILLFGEIIPQAACTGTAQMTIVMSAVPMVQCLITGLWVLSFPIARLLDYLVGESEGQTLYARSHLKALIRLHQKETRSDGKSDPGPHSNGGADDASALCADEVVVIEGALDLASKTAAEIIVPIDKVYMLEESEQLTPELRAELLAKGHSRVPVYRKHRWNVKGLLYIKSLICLDSHQNPPVGNLVRSTRPPVFCPPEMSLYDLLNEFQRGRHLAFITRNAQWHRSNWGEAGLPSPMTEESWAEEDDRALLGIATLEDVIEELIQEEIYDEFDNYNSSAANLDPAAVVIRGAAAAAPPPPPTTVKLSFARRVEDQSAPDLTERLLPPSKDFSSVTSGPLSSRDGVVFVKNLKTVFGLNQARRSRSKLDNEPTAATSIPIREEP